MARIDALADALRGDAAHASAYVAGQHWTPCTAPFTKAPPDGCLQGVATDLGGLTGFHPDAPDHASAAAVAVLLTRDRRGDWVTGVDGWLTVLQTGAGSGPDTLRLAVAHRLADLATRIGRRWDTEDEVRTLLADVATSVPGACSVYSALAMGAQPGALPTGESAEDSTCVRRDLARIGGPGGDYGYGTFRAAEGAVALVRAMGAAVRAGTAVGPEASRTRLRESVDALDVALTRLELKKVASGRAAAAALLNDLHHRAGIELSPTALPSSTIPVLRPGEHPSNQFSANTRPSDAAARPRTPRL
jgi:hypothetical protein